MANHIEMGAREAIIRLHEGGWKLRKIARHLGLDRKTVRRHIRLWISSKGTILRPGEGPPKGTILRAGKLSGRPSQCESYHQVIRDGVDAELSIQRIFQDLRTEHEFGGAYDSVKRYIRRHFPAASSRVWRMECSPGEEAQVDFGSGAPIEEPSSRRRYPHIFRIVLSHSRKAYSEAVLRQDSETFIRCLENAFRYFGGVPKTLVLDNLKAAVLRADWYDPELNPKLIEFGRHYGVVILPCGPRRPEHKGKVENSIKYLKRNALKGRSFASLAEENRFLADWERAIADQRIHGTTRQQVAHRFSLEKPHLLPLPPMLFPCFQEAQRQVHRDGYVEVQQAYYETPSEYIGQTIWVRWDARLVRLFDQGMNQIAVLARKRPGEFSSTLGARGHSATIEHTVVYWQDRAEKIGEHCGLWADAVLDNRGPWGTRVIRGLVALTRTHSSRVINEACRKALSMNQLRLRQVRALLANAIEQPELDFMSHHPLIRDMADYGAILSDLAPGPACGGHGSDEFFRPILATAADPVQALPCPVPQGGTHP